MAKPTLATIGYEGRTVEEFVDALIASGVALLVDVRAVASSRRPGFSKTALAGAVREHGIDYLHLRPLGTPKAGREAARSGRIAEMRRVYEEHLDSLEAQVAMEQLIEVSAERPVALLCYERDAAHCHRNILAERLAERGHAVHNL